MTTKQMQFNAAMERFDNNPIYKWTERAASFLNVSLQIALAGLVFAQSVGTLQQVIAFAVAFVLADFVNGWVHLQMDNSDNYQSATGPFYAAFHLHHRTPKYKRNPIVVVYYHESGSKLWLVAVQVVFLLGILSGSIKGIFAWGAVYFAILSSVAEVSHYLCHVRPTRLGKMLGRAKVLMSSRYHARHHREDNVQYAFLNGMTDPLLDLIARKFYRGYKSTTDTHYANYVGTDTENRS